MTEGSSLKLVEDEDYYLEGGLMVFTAYYLLRRGYCCGNDCRHCPYENKEAPVGEVPNSSGFRVRETDD